MHQYEIFTKQKMVDLIKEGIVMGSNQKAPQVDSQSSSFQNSMVRILIVGFCELNILFQSGYHNTGELGERVTFHMEGKVINGIKDSSSPEKISQLLGRSMSNFWKLVLGFMLMMC